MGAKRKRGKPPSSLHNRFSQLGESYHVDEDSDEFPALPLLNQCPDDNKSRFIIISTKGTTNEKPIGSYNPFLVQKGIESISKEIKNVKKLRSGDLLVETSNKKVAERFLSKSKLADIDVVISNHQYLNSVQGRIYSECIRDLEEDYLKEKLRPQHVLNIRKLTKKEGDNYVPTGAAIVTYDLIIRPSHIYIGWEKVKVSEHIPNPMRCQICQIIGHTKKYCPHPENPICRECGKEKHAEGQCGTFCVNCKIDTSYDPDCNEFRKAKSILKIRNENRCTNYQAKQIFYTSPQTYMIPKRNKNNKTIAEHIRSTSSNSNYQIKQIPSKVLSLEETPSNNISNQDNNTEDNIESNQNQPPSTEMDTCDNTLNFTPSSTYLQRRMQERKNRNKPSTSSSTQLSPSKKIQKH